MAQEVEPETGKLGVEGKMARKAENETQELGKSLIASEVEPETKESRGKGKMVLESKNIRFQNSAPFPLNMC